MTVYLVMTEWNRCGDYGQELDGVYASRESARQLVKELVEEDLQYGDFEKVEGLPSMQELINCVTLNKPLPTDYVRLYNGEDPYDTEDYIEYAVVEKEVHE